jgi:hypothetical protein
MFTSQEASVGRPGHLRLLIPLLCAIINSCFSVQTAAQIVSCPAVPTTYANGVIEGPVTGPGENGFDSAVATNADGAFIVAWQTRFHGSPLAFDNEIVVLRFGADGLAVCSGDPKILTGDGGTNGVSFQRCSVAMSLGGNVLVGWTGQVSGMGSSSMRLLRSDFNFTDDPATWPVRDAPIVNTRTDFEPSVAVAASGANKAFAWSYKDFDDPPPPNGLVRALDPDAPLAPIRECEPTAF